MPYLTPQELPEGDDCRPLSIPANSEWLALFGGALTELTKTWNWEDSGGLTVAETVAKMTEIIDAWYSTPCDHCVTPGGYRAIRIGSDGRIEELDENGDWVPGTGDYEIPPPEAREGGTEEDQICLAAKNAVNVLEQLYESLSDSWNEDLEEAEALTALIGVFVGIVDFAIAPISYGIYAFFAGLFGLLYSALNFILADLWDEQFSRTIECFLVNCATNVDGVVTFDWQCFIDQLNEQTNPFDLNEDQIRLYIQVLYILYFIGGVDGLNLAGATTAITDDECNCDCQVQLMISPPGYGTLEYLGGGYWLGTAALVSGVYRLGIVVDPESPTSMCWRYVEPTWTGTYTYADHRGCGECETPLYSPLAEGSNACAGYWANETPSSFTFNFKALCEGD